MVMARIFSEEHGLPVCPTQHRTSAHLLKGRLHHTGGSHEPGNSLNQWERAKKALHLVRANADAGSEIHTELQAKTCVNYLIIIRTI